MTAAELLELEARIEAATHHARIVTVKAAS